MKLSKQAREWRNKKRREKYASDPEFREKEKARVYAYYERKAAEAAALEAQQGREAAAEVEAVEAEKRRQKRKIDTTSI